MIAYIRGCSKRSDIWCKKSLQPFSANPSERLVLKFSNLGSIKN